MDNTWSQKGDTQTTHIDLTMARAILVSKQYDQDKVTLSAGCLPGIWQFLLHKELLGALWWVEVALTRDTLYLLQLTSCGSSLNVPEIYRISDVRSASLIHSIVIYQLHIHQTMCRQVCIVDSLHFMPAHTGKLHIVRRLARAFIDSLHVLKVCSEACKG